MQPNQKYPESQQEPLGPNQINWINEKYGKAFFRNPAPMIEHTFCKLPGENK